MLRATITIGRDTRHGGWAEEFVTVQGYVRVDSTTDSYDVTFVEVVDGGGLIDDLGDLSEFERQRADDALIAAYEHEQRGRAA